MVWASAKLEIWHTQANKGHAQKKPQNYFFARAQLKVKMSFEKYVFSSHEIFDLSFYVYSSTRPNLPIWFAIVLRAPSRMTSAFPVLFATCIISSQILNAKYFVWTKYILQKWEQKETFCRNSLMHLFNGDIHIVHCYSCPAQCL